MAKVNQRLWRIPGQRTKRKAWGFTAQIGGKQVRRYRAEWSREDPELLARGASRPAHRQVGRACLDDLLKHPGLWSRRNVGVPYTFAKRRSEGTDK
jgi:hypothetical protein